MDLYGRLQLRWSFGYNGSQLHFIDNDTLLYGCGNTLTFVDHSGKHIQSLPSEGKGVGPIATCPQASLVAYAEVTLQPWIFVLKHPACSPEATLKGKAQLEYSCLAFSANGKRIACLSGIPDFTLTVWDWEEGVEVCSTVVGSGYLELSFNPLNWKQLCLVGPGKATLFTLEQSNTFCLLTPLELQMPECSSPVGSRVHPKQPPLLVASKISGSVSHVGRKLERSETKSDQLLSSPPDMSRVLYKESYDDFVRERRPVVLTAHCWTAQQSIYLGCSGGQLLQVDFESGEVTVLTNPQLAQLMNQSFQSLASQSSSTAEAKEDVSSKQSVGEGTSTEPKPQTAHAVLSEGSISCLALSRRGLFTAGKNGTICCFDLSGELRLIESQDLQQPVAFLCWSTHHDRLAVSTKQGAIHLIDPLNLSSVSLISDHHCSELVGVDTLAPGLTHCVTCRSDGTVQVWSAEDAALISSFSLETECSSLACPLSCHMTAVGTASGHLCMLDMTDVAAPQPVARRHIFHSPITTIRYDQNGRFMGAISSSGPAFFFDARPSSKFAVLGYLDVSGKILDLSMLAAGQGEEASIQAAVLAESEEKRLLTLIKIPNSVVDEAPAELYADVTKRFSPDFVLKQEALLTEPVARITLAPNHSAFALLQSRLKLAKFAFPPLDEKGLADLEILPELCYHAHELSGGEAVLSFHQKWLASVAPDGKLLFRLVENPEKAVSSTPHHYSRGGCTGVALTTDSQQVFTTGDHGTLTCWKWEFTSHGNAKGSTAVEYAQKRMRAFEGLHHRENAALKAMAAEGHWEVESGESGREGGRNQKTWLETAEEEAHRTEDEKYVEIKAQLRQEIRDLREKVLSMMATNEGLPDIERLERHDFVLDTEEYQRLQAQQDGLIEQVREEIKLLHLAKMFLREKIKKQCWSDMTVKGKIVKAFQSRLEVSNYAMKARSEEKLRELERTKILRKIEIAEEKVRKAASASLTPAFQAATVEDSLLDEDELLEGAEQAQKGEEGPGDPDSLLGSHGAQYGGGSELLYDQFQLHSVVAKKHEIVLLENCIYCMKETFNKEFDEVFRLKKAEIARIQEKNLRIRKILGQLKLEDPIVQPSLDVDEEPERLLKVEDDEVSVEKYISPEKKKKMEEAEKIEEQKKLAEMGDKPRERALDMMMGGRLEANVEEDLFKDMPRPEFMLKDPVEMTEEEIRMARDFEKKEEAFLEEREKMKKALEAELRKLQSSILQAMEQFNERLHKLFRLKIKTEMSIQQEELKILRLARALLVEEEVTMREDQLNRLLDEKKVAKVAVGGAITTAKRHVEEGRKLYEQVASEDKELDRQFRRDFFDCDPFVDQLYKLFRRRPRGQRMKQGPSEGTLVPDPKSQNPFAQRPSSAARGGRGQPWEDPMSELDDPANMPEGLDTSQWERFVIARRIKVESEQKVKRVALELAEMEAFLRKREAEEEHIQQEIQDAFRELNKLQEDKTQHDLNLEIQLLLKQGQVEVETGEFVPDFSNSVLVHRSAIEELNSQIKGLGEGKLVSMEECKDFKRGIHMLEWELKKLRMEAEDLVERARDVQMLRVTKELQQRLMEEELANKDQHEIETLEKTIELNQKMQHSRVQERKRSLEQLQQQVGRKKRENQELDHQLVEMQVSVSERRGVENLAGVPPSEANAKQRMQNIVKRRRLVELVRAQAQEISVLTTEAERLRMRTFPALVQVD